LSLLHKSPNWYNLSLIFLLLMGEKVLKGSQSLRFWRLMPKGRKYQAHNKRTAPPPFQNFSKYNFNWYSSIGIYFN
jgi:hypothetical protein